MLIHTVRGGETLYNIARKYSVPATKILADNDLSGDRLTVGDELIILMPTRTVTVRGGETLYTISRRFDVKQAKLLASNPALCGKATVRPGQILTVKQDAPTLGSASAIGYIERGCNRENLTRSLPYLTYIAVMEYIIAGGGIKLLFDGSWACAAVSKDKKTPLLGIRDTSRGEFLVSEDGGFSLIDALIDVAKSGGYKGVVLSGRDAAANRPDEFCKFILEARKRFIGCDLILFTEVDKRSPTDSSELSDGAIFFPSDTSIEETRSELLSFAKSAESSKVAVALRSSAAFGDNALTIPEAKHLCYRSGLSLETDKRTLITGFDYKQYKIGKSETLRVSFPSPQYTKAKLEYLSELGFMGIATDIDTAHICHMSMFNAMFARADYSLV